MTADDDGSGGIGAPLPTAPLTSLANGLNLAAAAGKSTGLSRPSMVKEFANEESMKWVYAKYFPQAAYYSLVCSTNYYYGGIYPYIPFLPIIIEERVMCSIHCHKWILR